MKKILGILLTVVMVISTITPLYASSGPVQVWLTNSDGQMDGKVEAELNVKATNGSVKIVGGKVGQVNDSIWFEVMADSGYEFDYYTLVKEGNVDNGNGYYVNEAMAALFGGTGTINEATEDIDQLFDLNVEMTTTSSAIRVVAEVSLDRIDRNGPKLTAHLEPEIIINANIIFKKIVEEITKYTITATADPDVATFEGTGTQEEGTPYEVTYTITDPNYEFVSWTGGEASGESLNGNLDLVANFKLIEEEVVEPEEYTITATADPDVATFEGTGTQEEGTPYEVTYTITDPNYEFVSWTGGEASGESLNGNLDLVANFKLIEEEVVEPEEYTITATADPDVATFEGTGTQEEGTPYEVTYTITDSNYEFVSWTGGAASGESLNGNLDLVANFKLIEEVVEPEEYTIRATADPDVATFEGTGTQEEGTPYEVTYTITDPNYEFVSWTGGEASGESLNGNLDLVANFKLIEEVVEPEEYTITATADPDVATFEGTGTQEEGTPYEVTYTITDSNYEFVSWTGGEASGESLNGNLDLVANFKLIEETSSSSSSSSSVKRYDVTAVSSPAGVASFTGTGVNIRSGSSYEVNYKDVADGYEFVSWTGDPEGRLNGDINLVANFKLIPATFDVSIVSSPAGVGTFTGELVDVEDGTTYSVTVESIADGYEFDKWLGGDASGTIDGSNVELIAVFKEIAEDELIDEETPQDVLDATEIGDETLPEELPNTSGIPYEAFAVMGTMITGLGVSLRKKSNK